MLAKSENNKFISRMQKSTEPIKLFLPRRLHFCKKGYEYHHAVRNMQKKSEVIVSPSTAMTSWRILVSSTYIAMSMILIALSLLYLNKVGAV